MTICGEDSACSLYTDELVDYFLSTFRFGASQIADEAQGEDYHRKRREAYGVSVRKCFKLFNGPVWSRAHGLLHVCHGCHLLSVTCLRAS